MAGETGSCSPNLPKLSLSEFTTEHMNHGEGREMSLSMLAGTVLWDPCAFLHPSVGPFL